MSNLKVLLCEENQINRRIMKRLLEMNQLEVSEASTSIEAIEMLETEIVDFVIMDQHTASINAYETIKKLRKTKVVPIILATSDVLKIDENLKKLGVIDVMLKPLQIDDIKRVIGKLSNAINPDDFKEFSVEEFQKVYVEKAFQVEIIQAFMSESNSDIKRVKDAYKTKNVDAIYGALHYMKGTFSYLKALKILDFTQSILNKLKEKDLDFALDLEESFYQYYDQLYKDLKTYLELVK